MPTIDSENRKQIREPFDVLIKMSLAEDDIDMSYSGYSSAKVADGVLDERRWPARKLADLQGDGFPLDGTYVLYDSATLPSQANGKIGVRSNVGENVSVTVTGSNTMASLTIIVTGADSVTYNGTTTQITGNTVTIPLLSTSVTLEFAPASENERIEISDIFPDVEFKITNENLIRATVSLRSDLSLFDQTLPESEINIEVYHDVDISSDVANIPIDTPITYQAGYPEDMSPERKFYVAGQVTWADNVLSIHAVDAVHFLEDVNVVAPLSNEGSIRFRGLTLYLFALAGVMPSYSDYDAWWTGDKYRWIVPEDTSARKLIAFLNQCMNITDDNAVLLDGSYELSSPLQFAYIDAGIPTIRSHYPRYEPIRTIYEEDCSDVTKNIDRRNGSITTTWTGLELPVREEGGLTKVGTATMTRNVGTSLHFDAYTDYWQIGLFLGRNYDNETAQKLISRYGTLWGWGYMLTVVPAKSDGASITSSPKVQFVTTIEKLAKGEIPQEEFRNYPDADSDYPFSSFVPWSQSYDGWRYDNNASHKIYTAQQMWDVLRGANIIDSSAESIDLDIYGWAYQTDKQTKTYTTISDGARYDYGDAPIIGRLSASATNASEIEIYPSKMLPAPLYRSTVAGSFKWKGDPRCQPRDRISFARLDGTTETITLENITLTHEGGGTSAEITYRKGAF